MWGGQTRTVNSVSARLTGHRALNFSLSLFPNSQGSKNEHTGPCKPVLFVCLFVCSMDVRDSNSNLHAYITNTLTQQALSPSLNERPRVVPL